MILYWLIGSGVTVKAVCDSATPQDSRIYGSVDDNVVIKISKVGLNDWTVDIVSSLPVNINLAERYLCAMNATLDKRVILKQILNGEQTFGIPYWAAVEVVKKTNLVNINEALIRIHRAGLNFSHEEECASSGTLSKERFELMQICPDPDMVLS